MRHGIASSVHAVDVVHGDAQLYRLVLKIFVRDDPTEPDQAGREARILRIVAGGPIPVPRLLAVDRDGESCGVPALLMTRLDGHVVLRPRRLRSWIRGLAELLHRLHSIRADPATLGRYATYQLPAGAEPPRSTSHRSAWLQAITRIAATPPEEPACFIHRDFHPGNVLWTGGRASGVVDWLQGCGARPPLTSAIAAGTSGTCTAAKPPTPSSPSTGSWSRSTRPTTLIGTWRPHSAATRSGSPTATDAQST